MDQKSVPKALQQRGSAMFKAKTDRGSDPPTEPLAEGLQRELWGPNVIEVTLTAFVDGPTGKVRYEAAVYDGASRELVDLVFRWLNFDGSFRDILAEWMEALDTAKSRVCPF